MSKKPLHFKGCLVSRVVKDYIIQTGLETGDSIYGGKFNDEKEGLKIPSTQFSVAMANSGKNSNTGITAVLLCSFSSLISLRK